jgi:hypothetical protein
MDKVAAGYGQHLVHLEIGFGRLRRDGRRGV